MPTVAATLQAFGPTTLAVRAVAAVLGTVPGAGSLQPWSSVDDAVRELRPDAGDAVLDDARARVDAAWASELLDLAGRVDALDRRLATHHVPGEGLEAQGGDAVLKLLLLAVLASRGGTGAPEARVETLRTARAGRALLAWWAAVDVTLSLGGAEVGRLLAAHRAEQSGRLVSLGGEHVLDGVGPVLDAMLPTAAKVVDASAKRADTLARALAPFVPGLVVASPDVAEVVAVRADRLPVYKWLVARFAAELAARAAVDGR